MTPEYLLEKRKQSITTIFHKYLLALSKGSTNFLYCFFEGDDDPGYYFSRIAIFFNNHETIVCNGKKNILAIYDHLIKTSYIHKYKHGFFIDRDFDVPNTINAIFETTRYSIENYYTSELTLASILKNEFNLQTTDNSFTDILKLYNVRINEFHETVLLYNAWYSCIKMENDMTVKLTETFPKKFLNIDMENGINGNYNQTDIENLHPKAVKISKYKLEQTIVQFRETNLSHRLRGKWELQFFKSFLRYLINDARNPAKNQFNIQKKAFNFQDDLFISQLSQYAENPEFLTEYLQSLL